MLHLNLWIFQLFEILLLFKKIKFKLFLKHSNNEQLLEEKYFMSKT